MTRLNASFPIVDEEGKMTQAFRDEMTRLSESVTIRGTGSPEGVIEAPQYSEYVDKTGTASTIKYVKRDTDIAGDRSKGWILI